jgi:hypothetical protein
VGGGGWGEGEGQCVNIGPVDVAQQWNTATSRESVPNTRTRAPTGTKSNLQTRQHNKATPPPHRTMMPRLQLLAFMLVASTAAVHYGDPNTPPGCLKDEIVVAHLQGLEGNFCSPSCEFRTCPTDVPNNVTAKPNCDVTIAGVKFCSLKCNGRTECGSNASCKAISGTGVCTYNDAPPPPSSPHWAPVDSPSFQSLTTAMAVGFTKDGRVGFSGAGQDGKGA